MILDAAGQRQGNGGGCRRKIDRGDEVLVPVVKVEVQMSSIGRGVSAILQIMVGDRRDSVDGARLRIDCQNVRVVGCNQAQRGDPIHRHQLPQLHVEVGHYMHIRAVASPDGQIRLRGVGGDDDDVGHVAGVVESSQELVTFDEFGVFVGNDLGDRLYGSRLLRCKSADGDVRILQMKNEEIVDECHDSAVFAPCI